MNITIYKSDEWVSPVEKYYDGAAWQEYTQYKYQNDNWYKLHRLTDKLILCHSESGLHCMEIEDGSYRWQLSRTTGCTPAIDQANGIVYFQSQGQLDKINVLTGDVLDYISISAPSNKTQVANTVYINDSHGEYIATYWYSGAAIYQSAIRVYDSDLDLVWQKTGLPLSKKYTICYADGMLFAGYGDSFIEDVLELDPGGACDAEDRNITAYDITDGSVVWETNIWDEIDPDTYSGLGLPIDPTVRDILYCNGYLFAETTGTPNILFVLNASTGAIVYQYDGFEDEFYRNTSCAPPSFSGGYFISPSIQGDCVNIINCGTGVKTDWSGAFQDSQHNHRVAPKNALLTISQPYLVGQINTAQQGVTVHNGILFIDRGNTTTIAFPVLDRTGGFIMSVDLGTLETVRTYDFADIYDSTPLVVQDLSGEWLVVGLEYQNERTSCRKVSDGTLVWNSTANQPGNQFFGYAIYHK